MVWNNKLIEYLYTIEIIIITYFNYIEILNPSRLAPSLKTIKLIGY